MTTLNENQKLAQYFDVREFGIYKNIKLCRLDDLTLLSNPPQYPFYDENNDIYNIRYNEILEISEIQSF